MKTETLDCRIKRAKSKSEKLALALGLRNKKPPYSEARELVKLWKQIANLQRLNPKTFCYEDEDGVRTVGDHIDELWDDASSRTADAFRMAILKDDIGFIKAVASAMENQRTAKTVWPDRRRVLMLKTYLQSSFVSPSALADGMCKHSPNLNKGTERRTFSRLATACGVTTPSKSSRRIGQNSRKKKSTS